MTGRKGSVVSTDDGIQYESHSELDAPLEILNLTVKQRFMDGGKVQELWSISAFSILLDHLGHLPQHIEVET